MGSQRDAESAPRAGRADPAGMPPPGVLRQYGLDKGAVELVSSKGDKPVWRIDTPKGPAYLKRMPNKRSRVLFSMGAAEHLHAQAAGVPRPLRTREGELVAMDGAVCYALLSPIDGDKPIYARDLEAVASALARFHARSAGYVPPPGSRRRDHLDTWPDAYRRGRAVLRASAVLARSLRRPVDRFVQDAALLQRSALQAQQRLEAVIGDAVEEARARPLLCHQDFAASNLRIAGGVVRAFDVDSVAFDLPVRDLRKLLTKVAKAEGRWRADRVLQVLRAYEAERPLSRAERAVLLTDLAFPHLVVGGAKKFFLKPPREWGLEETGRRLDAVVDLESSKRAMLPEVAREWGQCS